MWALMDLCTRTHTHIHQLYLAMLLWSVPGMQQCCHGYPQTHPPSYKRGDAERFRGAGAVPPPPNPQPPFSIPFPPKLNRCPLFSQKKPAQPQKDSLLVNWGGLEAHSSYLVPVSGPLLLLTWMGCNRAMKECYLDRASTKLKLQLDSENLK